MTTGTVARWCVLAALAAGLAACADGGTAPGTAFHRDGPGIRTGVRAGCRAAAGGPVAARRDARERRRSDLPAPGRLVDRQCPRLARGRGAAAVGRQGRDVRRDLGDRAHRGGSHDPQRGPGRRQRHQNELPDAARQRRRVSPQPAERAPECAGHDGARQPRGLAGSVPDRQAGRAAREERPADDHRELRARPARSDRRRPGAQANPGHEPRARHQHPGDDRAPKRRRPLLPARVRRLALVAVADRSVDAAARGAARARRRGHTSGRGRHRRPPRRGAERHAEAIARPAACPRFTSPRHRPR